MFPVSPQNEIEILKAENDRLKAETGHVAKPARPASESASSTSSSSSRQSLGLSLNNLNVAESVASGEFVRALPEPKRACDVTSEATSTLETLAHRNPHAFPLGSVNTLILRHSPFPLQVHSLS